MKRRTWISATIGALGSLAHPAIWAKEDFPKQLIRWVVPYPAGGGTDNLARAVAERMRIGLQQQLIIDNRPGASTNIGAEMVARAKPDGYTVMSADNAVLAFNEHLFKSLRYSPEADFSFIGAIGRFPLALVVTPEFPAKTYAEFAAYVKANPDKVSYASAGNGSPHHLAMELFKYRTGLQLTHIPYKGAAPAIQDVMAGQVGAMFLDLASGLPIVQTGKVRALAIASPKRSSVLPQLATLDELGVKDAEVFAFQGMLGPAEMPGPVVARLNTELRAAMQDPNVLKKFTDFGFEPLLLSPQEFKQLARQEAERWGKVIRANNIALD